MYKMTNQMRATNCKECNIGKKAKWEIMSIPKSMTLAQMTTPTVDHKAVAKTAVVCRLKGG